MWKRRLCRVMAAVLGLEMLLCAPAAEHVQAEGSGKESVITELPGTTTVEKPYDDSFLKVTGYVQEGVGDRSQYYREYMEYNEAKKKEFIAAGGREEDYVYQSTEDYIIVRNEEEFCDAVYSADVKVIELAADLNLGYKYLESLDIDTDGPITQISDYKKGNEPISSPDLMRDGVSKLTLRDREHLTLYSKNGSTIYHCELGLEHCDDIVIRNIGIQGLNEWDDLPQGTVGTAGGHKRYDWDNISVYASKNIWIDHCTLGIAYDGSIDITDGSTASITWCEIGVPDERILAEMQNTIDYMEEQYRLGRAHRFYTALREGGATPEQLMRFSLLNDKVHAFSCSEAYYDVNIHDRITMAYNFYKNSVQRVPQIRCGNAHMFNCWVDSFDYREIHAELSDASYGTQTDADGKRISPITYAKSKEDCSTLGLCRANSALGGATIGTDTCVFEGVINPIISKELQTKGTQDPGYQEGAVNHVLIVNSSTQSRRTDAVYTGSSWDNNGVNKFCGEDYWNGDRVSYGNFLWAKWENITKETLPESEAKKLKPGEFYEKYYIGSDKLDYEYQTVPLDQVKETLDGASGCGKIGLSGEDWLRTGQIGGDTEQTSCRAVFDYRDGSTPARVITGHAAEAVPLPDRPERKGYAFWGWYTQEKSADGYIEKKLEGNTVTLANDQYIYAKWNPSTCMVRLELNGGTTEREVSIAVPYGSVFNLTSYGNDQVKKDGFLLEGWYTDQKFTEKVWFVPLETGMTLYAKWVREYPVVFELNGGTTSAQTTYKWLENHTYDLSVLNSSNVTKEGYELEGWYADEALTQPVSSVNLTQSAVFYAKWAAAYKLTFQLNGGIAGKKTTYQYKESAVVEPLAVLGKEDLYRRGYVFQGWYLDQDLQKKADTVLIENDTVVYAKWTKEGEGDVPSEPPVIQPSETPTARPSEAPTARPSEEPTAQPSSIPTARPSEAPSETPEVPVKFGDVTGDGKVDLEDASLVLKAALKITRLTDQQIANADFNNDGTLDLYDAQQLLKKALKIIQ